MSSTNEPLPSLVVMGVSGTGKSSVGRELARRYGMEFIEGDDHHPQANIDKMASGTPLDDEDRWPWLTDLGEQIAAAAPDPVVLTCSSLKRSYRDLLRRSSKERAVLFVYLRGSRELLMGRMQARERHFMPASLLDSQLDTLEPLQFDEWAVVVDVAPPMEQVIDNAADAVRQTRATR